MRDRLIVLCGLLAASLAGAPPVRAQEVSISHLSAARELMTVAGASATIDRIIPVLINDIRRIAVTRPELSKDIEQVLTTMAPEFERQKQQGYVVAARAYAKYLTEAEMKEAILFFKSPVGVKYVQVQPDLTEEIVNNVTGWGQLAAEYVMTRVRAEMLKRGHQLQ